MRAKAIRWSLPSGFSVLVLLTGYFGVNVAQLGEKRLQAVGQILDAVGVVLHEGIGEHALQLHGRHCAIRLVGFCLSLLFSDFLL